VRENDGVARVPEAAVAHGKLHTVARRYMNVLLAPAPLYGPATSRQAIADARGPIIQSGCGSVRLAHLITGRGHGITGPLASELGMHTGLRRDTDEAGSGSSARPSCVGAPTVRRLMKPVRRKPPHDPLADGLGTGIVGWFGVEHDRHSIAPQPHWFAAFM
jgi:hypothetical protein